jgi:hypothetical protein
LDEVDAEEAKEVDEGGDEGDNWVFFSLILLLSSSFVYRVANWVFFQTFLMFELINLKT